MIEKEELQQESDSLVEVNSLKEQIAVLKENEKVLIAEVQRLSARVSGHVDLSYTEDDIIKGFEEFLLMEDRSLQVLIREVGYDILSLALQGCSEEILNKVFLNMSTNGADMLREDIAINRATRPEVIVSAKKELLRSMQRLLFLGR